VCAASRLFLPAVLAGVVAASPTRQPITGWIVAGLVATLLSVRGRRAESFGCAVARSALTGYLRPLTPRRPDREPADTTTVDR
jgi:hypothetical protein